MLFAALGPSVQRVYSVEENSSYEVKIKFGFASLPLCFSLLLSPSQLEVLKTLGCRRHPSDVWLLERNPQVRALEYSASSLLIGT